MEGAYIMKLNKIAIALLAAVTIIGAPKIGVRAATITQDTIIQNANTWLSKALAEENFYSYNMAYAEILKIQDSSVQGQLLSKLNILNEKVWTSDITNYVALLGQLTNTGSGKIYDQTEALIRSSSSIKAVDKEYLLGEITGWGRKLVYTTDYTKAVDNLNIAWNTINSSNIEAAESYINKVTNSYSKAYLLEELAKIKTIFAENNNGITYNEDGIPIVKSLDIYKTLLRNALQNFDSSIKIEIRGYSETVYSLEVINDLFIENPILNYGYSGANAEMSWYGDGSVRTVDITFNYDKTKDEMVMMKTAVEKKAKEILSSIITPTMKDYQKEKAIHDYVVNNSRYDIENYNANTIPPESYSDYGILIKGVAVCDGYAKAMFRLLNDAGVKTLYVVGTADGGAHAWNIVQLGGQYYQLDSTWDDPVSSNGNILSYKYFNVTDSVIGKDHVWDRSKYPVCTATTYSYSNIK
jgi:hypothetical protein